MIHVLAINIGQPVEIMQRRGKPVYSSIGKYRLPDGPVEVGETNIVGDRQADLAVQGGPDKAVYVYPAEHLPWWQAELGYEGGDASFGENLSISGITEQEARIGDIWQWGDVRLQISQPRSPCFKLAQRTGHLDMIKRLAASGRTGWYLRVLQTGITSQQEPITIVAQDPAGFTVHDAFQAGTFRGAVDPATRQRYAAHPALSQAWRDELLGQ